MSLLRGGRACRASRGVCALALPTVAARVLAGLVAATSVAVAGASACVDTYRDAFSAAKGKVAPKDVAKLYNVWCQKNMRVSSAKSMDELCAPLVKKVDDKMIWVPPDTDVTPEIACESAEKLKERFPEHVAVAEASMKNADADSAQRKKRFDTVKKVKAMLDSELKDAVRAAGEDLVKRLGEKFRKRGKEELGAVAEEAPYQAMVKTVEEAATLNARGMETKLLQKMEEVVGTWASKWAKSAGKATTGAEL